MQITASQCLVLGCYTGEGPTNCHGIIYALVRPQLLNSFALTFRTTFPCTFVSDIIIYEKMGIQY